MLLLLLLLLLLLRPMHREQAVVGDLGMAANGGCRSSSMDLLRDSYKTTWRAIIHIIPLSLN